ncbi:MAG: beta-lactamase family protein [Myxococcales bacterium]|nr:beta-lactamase family protein [Myxococcales bacterium]
MGNDRRERVQVEAARLVDEGVRSNVFPGGAVCVAYRDDDRWETIEVARGELAPRLGPVRTDTPYDLASLTKPFVATAALRLRAAGRLDLDETLGDTLPETRGAPAAGASIEALATHRAGLAAWGALYLDLPDPPGSAGAQRWMVVHAARRVEARPSEQAVYSDLGYLLLGRMLEVRAGTSLAALVSSEVLGPLGVADAIVYPAALPDDAAARLAERAPPTERCGWRGRLLRGEVHDDNCAAFGGVAGHAGLFGTARSVAALGQATLDALDAGSRQGPAAAAEAFLPSELTAWALAERPGGSLRFGWDGKSAPSSAGTRTSPDSFGHLGYTGTSIWCDPARGLVVVLLTNRVFPTRANVKIRGFRPAFHDGILAAFDA